MRSGALQDISKLLSGSVLAKAFGVVALILFTRLLTKEEMAAFPTFLMLAGLCDLIMTFGIFSQIMRELPSLWLEDRPQARSLAVTSSAVILVGTAIPALAAFVWSGPIARLIFRDPAQGWIIVVMAPGFVAYVISRIAEYLMWGRGQFGAISVLQILDSIIRPTCTVGFYFAMGYPGVVTGIVVAQCIMAALGFYYVRDLFIGRLPRLYPIRKLILDSMPYYIGNYLSYVRGDGDIVIVTSFLGPSKLAEYYVAKTLYVNISIVLTALDKVALERLARLVRTNEFADRVRKLFVQISRTTVPLVFFLIAVTPYAMTVLAGPRYSGVSWVAVVLLLSAAVQFVSLPVDRAVFLMVPGFVRVSYAVVESVAVVVSALALVPIAGLVGVAAARVFAFAITTFFGMYVLRRSANLTFPLGAMLGTTMAVVPGTVLALLFAPATPSVSGAVMWSAVVAIGWSAAFLGLTYVIDRPFFDSMNTMARQQYRAYFVA